MARFQLNIALDSSIGSKLTPLTLVGKAVFPTATNGFNELGNVDHSTGIALRDIKEDEELYGNYGLSSQVKTVI